jgi:uncharacterized protein YbjT (DUF2867 family)
VRVAVLGATGTIGRALVPELAAEHEVVAMSRRPREQPGGGVTWLAGDVADPDAVRRVLDGADVAYYLVHSLGTADFEARDRKAAAVVAAEAGHCGVRQIVYLGGLGDDADTLSEHLRSRRETGETLASGRTPVTTLRAAMVVGRGSAAFETIVALVRRLPAMVMPRWVGTPTQPIALADVVAYLAGVCGRHDTFGEQYDAGGPDVLTYRAMIERVAGVLGRRPLLVQVPVLTPRLSSLWLHLVTPVEADVARPLVEGLRSPTVARDDRIRTIVPRPLNPFDEAARAALLTDT